MRRDVLRRVRWANVSLPCDVLIAFTTVVIWPLISPPPPRLPPDTPRPLVQATPQPPAPKVGDRRRRAARSPRPALRKTPERRRRFPGPRARTTTRTPAREATPNA